MFFQENGQYRCAVYLRLSRSDGDQQESNSIKNQRALLNDYLGKHPRGGWFPGHIAPLDSSKMCFYDNMFCKDCKSFGDYLRIIFRNCLVLRAKMRYNI